MKKHLFFLALMFVGLTFTPTDASAAPTILKVEIETDPETGEVEISCDVEGFNCIKGDGS